MRVLLSGGGTGGHVYPALAIAHALQASGPSNGADARAARDRPAHSVLYVGSRSGVERELALRAGLPFVGVDTGQFRGRTLWGMASSAWRVQRGIRQARAILAAFQPDLVFLTGGYVTVPVAIAAWLAGVPQLIYLPDLTPGLAVRLLSHLAQHVAVTLESAARHFPGKAVVTGYPVRAELLAAASDPAGARRRLGLNGHRPVLLVMGGSHGARSINRAICAALPALLERAQVIHITGRLDWPWVQRERERLPSSLQREYHPHPYLHEALADALAAADLVVNRAGASVLGELPAVGAPAVLIPYPHAGGHQRANARFLAERGAARLIEDHRVHEELAPTLLALLADEAARQRMREAARSLARAEATQRIVRLMEAMVEQRG